MANFILCANDRILFSLWMNETPQHYSIMTLRNISIYLFFLKYFYIKCHCVYIANYFLRSFHYVAHGLSVRECCVTGTGSWCVQLLCYVQMFSWVILLLLAVTLLLSPILQWFLALEEEGMICTIHLGFSILQSLIFCTLVNCQSLC